MSAALTRSKPQTAILPTVNEFAQPIFSVLVKRTYSFRPGSRAQRLDADEPLRLVDAYYENGSPEWVTVRHEADQLAPYKLFTDVIVLGSAQAKENRPVYEQELAVTVGAKRKAVHVLGDRHCEYRAGATPIISDPLPFTRIEARYERAYGGVDERSEPGMPFHYPRNTKGCGLVIKNSIEAVHGLRLPNFEDPSDQLTPDRIVLEQRSRWNDQPLPQGFGWFEKVWYPRCSFVGAMPVDVDVRRPIREELLGLVPPKQLQLARQFKLPSFDVRFNQGAGFGLMLSNVQTDDRVTLEGWTLDGTLTFQLPDETPRVMLDISLGENELTSVLHTICIEPDLSRVHVTWRAAHAYPGHDWLPEMKHLRLSVDGGVVQ